MSETPQNPVVLFVDDERNNRLIFRHTLSSLLSLRMAESGKEALELLAKEPVQIVLADLRMPGMSGVALARAVREHHPSLPFFIVTGYPGDPELEGVVERGLVRQIFLKPWNPIELVAAFHAALREPTKG
jgi:two-component system response regulator HupR/HoxA